MSEFKDKISVVLQKMNYSFAELANHLGMSDEQLTEAIDNKKVELRTLEFISKELRIPLYSFFRDDEFNIGKSIESPFYTNKVEKNELEQLQIENTMLKNEVDKLRQDLIKCEKKMKVFL